MDTVNREERKDFQGKIEIKLREAGQKLDSMWMKARQSVGQVRTDLHKQIPVLREKQHLAREKFEGLKKSSDALWESTKSAAKQTWSDLEKIMEKVDIKSK